MYTESQINALIRRGNKKLPSTTWIFNCGTARDCPSKALGLCQCADKCYAMKAERMYKNVLPFRERQRALWGNVTPKRFVSALFLASNRSRTRAMESFRFNEAGDFSTQQDINWLTAVCKILKQAGVSCYGYTARTDLNLTGLLKHSSVNVSNDKRNWIDKGANRFRAVKQATGKNPVCPGSCKACSLCQKVRGLEIEIPLH